jgi:hypothetical protein
MLGITVGTLLRPLLGITVGMLIRPLPGVRGVRGEPLAGWPALFRSQLNNLSTFLKPPATVV